jgi:hypothetical protein
MVDTESIAKKILGIFIILVILCLVGFTLSLLLPMFSIFPYGIANTPSPWITLVSCLVTPVVALSGFKIAKTLIND